MQDEANPSAAPGNRRGAGAGAGLTDREARLKAALKANMARRKAQARLRGATEAAPEGDLPFVGQTGRPAGDGRDDTNVNG